VAPAVKDICERYGLPYNTGPLSKQWGTVHRTILRLAFPGGKPRPKPGPYHSADDPSRKTAPSEAARFRSRLPADHPAAGPEHEHGGVEVEPPPR
jgi:linoleoyl-CoA desaturase